MKNVLNLILIFTITSISFSQNGSSGLSKYSFNNKKTFSLPRLIIVKEVRKQTFSNPYLYGIPYEVLDGGATRFNGKKNWTLNRKEIRIGLGATQFLGDLGGKDQIGTDYRLKDLDWASTSINAEIGYRYRFKRLFATTTSIHVGILKGDDALTQDPVRNARNLSFRAPFIDVTQRLEFMIYLKEKVGKRYNIKGLHGFKNRNEQIYVFAGVGLIGFMPQAQYQGAWVNLRPLSTEGQGMVGGIANRLPVTVTVPMGIGFRVGISREWRVGIEASYVKTFSDYIDDVHGIYYDKDLLFAQKGEIAYALSDRSGGNQGFGTGMQRGDKQKDSYYHINIIVSRNVTYRNYTKTHRHLKLQKGRYKF